MRRYAHIVNNIVMNVSMWDEVSEFNPGDGVLFVPIDNLGEIGWIYDNGVFIEPEYKDEYEEWDS